MKTHAVPMPKEHDNTQPVTQAVQQLVDWLRKITKHLNIYIFFPPITQWCSISDVLFTGGREVSDFSVLKYY